MPVKSNPRSFAFEGVAPHTERLAYVPGIHEPNPEDFASHADLTTKAAHEL